jgi:hypothetical protein
MGRPFVRNVLAASLLLLAAAGALNFAVDPFQQYRIPSAYAARFYPVFQRFQASGIARHYAFDRAIVGSSMTENLAASEVDGALGGKSFNLSLSAVTAYDARRVLEAALGRGGLKQVLYNIDFNAFSGPVNRTGFPEAFPEYLYDAHRGNDYPYLLSASTLKKSLETLGGWKVNRFSTDADRPWYWAASAQFSARRVVDGLDPSDLNRRFRQPPRTLEGMRASFDANVLPLVERHPGVEWIFVYPPYSILVWADFRQRGQLDVTLDFKRHVFARLGSRPNVRLFDFQAERTLVADLDRYSDIYHYDPRASRWTIEMIAAGRYRVDAANLETGIADLRWLAERADPESIIRSAKGRAP